MTQDQATTTAPGLEETLPPELEYDMTDWPTLRGASGDYYMVASDGPQSRGLFLRFKIDQVIPPAKEYPGVTYLQTLQVNVLAYNIKRMVALLGVGGLMRAMQG